MFDKLEDLVNRLEELNLELTDPDVIADQERYRRYMKEQNELMPIVEKYQEYKACLLYGSPSPRDLSRSRMPSSA